MKKWNVLPCDRSSAETLARQYQVPAVMGVLMQARGLTDPEQIEKTFSAEAVFADPMELADMGKAVDRLWRAVDAFEKIAVYGDYDADGVTSTAMLYSYLESCGADVLYYIPDRENEGYGLNLEAIAALREQGVQLIVTVDNGVSSIEEVDYANSLGMDVVVTDHHQPRESLPAAVAVVDPHRQDCPSVFKEFSGVGVAFKLIMAMEGPGCDVTGLLENYADLAAIGTIGDIVPLTGENRMLVKAGLPLLSRTDRLGIQALLENAGLDNRTLNAGNVTFGVVPRINATGRMGAPERAVRLLLSEDPDEAAQLALDICDNNTYRREIESEIFDRAVSVLQERPGLLQDRVLVIAGEDWHAGVIGIVASRIVERFGKPSILIAVNNGEAKGSGRSVEGFSLFDAVCSCADLLTKFGGHPMAAGLSLPPEQIEAFRVKINRFAAERYPLMPLPKLRIDCLLEPEELNLELPRCVKLLEPFGTGNPAPLFGLYQAKLTDVTPVGGGKHLRLTLMKGQYAIRCMRFGTTLEQFPYVPGDLLDLAVTVEDRPFNGKSTLSIVVRDCKPAGLDGGKILRERQIYEKSQRGEHLSQAEAASLIPDRDAFAAVYRFLRAGKGFEGQEEVLLCRLHNPALELGKLFMILDVLEEHGLIRQRRFGGACKISVEPVQAKVDLFDSEILAGLQRLQEEGEAYVRASQNL
ncbi:single-stranded-DNA-specific exonuclease RecJ [Anaeromassilibacillus senegalensis]|uniref:single-stranded-DNA-specific exonuclease RecJ n=1 Tax=Anaeromassilibacillus senegalensis TaxID=1673717 RepID=UPI000683166E|nr:single-stranded-DNA-specific exonuclease RecJ [Anaeromassilibacillus senegalensis]